VNAGVEVVDRTGLGLAQAPVIDLVEAVMAAEGVSGAVAIAFVDDQEMAGLSGRFRGPAEPTDVLTFRYADDDSEWLEGAVREPGAGPGGLEGGSASDLGEVIVCPAMVDRYAWDEGADFGAQLAWTLVHGVLHLVGYDHEKDDGEMRRRERVLLEELGRLVRAFSPFREH
jgi:rRNA maturation RNase YbeY